MGGSCGTYGRQERYIQALVVTREGKRPFGRPRLKWVDDIKMYLQEVGWGDRNWRALPHYKECDNEISGSIKCGEFLDRLKTC
jgi:hypothetical protein